MPWTPGTKGSTFLNNFENKWVLISKAIITGKNNINLINLSPILTMFFEKQTNNF